MVYVIIIDFLCLPITTVSKSFLFFFLQLPAYATATAMPDLNCVCDLHHSSWQHQILNWLSEARNQTCVFMDTNQIYICWDTMGTPSTVLLLWELLSSSAPDPPEQKQWHFKADPSPAPLPTTDGCDLNPMPGPASRYHTENHCTESWASNFKDES